MSREADIINRINDIKKEAELITVLKDIKTELAGIRMELENLRESNVEIAEDITINPTLPDDDLTSFWVETMNHIDLNTKYIHCAYCGYEVLMMDDARKPFRCPECKRRMV